MAASATMLAIIGAPLLPAPGRKRLGVVFRTPAVARDSGRRGIS